MSFSAISFVVFLVVSLIVFGLIVIKSVQNYKKVFHSKGKIVGKGAVAFLLWCIMSGYVFVSQAVYSIGASHTITQTTPSNTDSVITELIILQIAWTLLGAVLIYWVSRQPKEKIERLQ